MPHAIHLFLEQVKNGLWNDKAWFYINGPHILQCGPEIDEELDYDHDHDSEDEEIELHHLALQPFRKANLETLSFPEYTNSYPHTKWTIGFTGRPGGPEWYINKVRGCLDVKVGPFGVFNNFIFLL